MTTSIPGALIEQVAVNLRAVELRYAGRENFSHQLTVTLHETRDVGTRDMLRRWQKLARDNRTNSGSYKTVYSTSIELVLYDDIPLEVKRIKLIGAWVENLDDSSLDTASGAVSVSCTFSYDYLEESNA